MGKGEIGRNEQFLLFPQCFLLNQIIVSPFVHIFDIISLFAAEFKEPKIGISGKGLTDNLLGIMQEGEALIHYHTMLHFYTLKIYSCGKHCEKSRNCL